jgi:hypothetical protein
MEIVFLTPLADLDAKPLSISPLEQGKGTRMSSRNIAIRMLLTVIALAALAQGLTAAQQPWSLTPPAQQSLGAAPAGPLSDLFTPAASPKTCGPVCDTSSGGSTPIEVATGTSCSDALANLTAQVTALARAECQNETGLGACQVMVGSRPCNIVGPSSYPVHGFANYHGRDTTC